MFKLYPVPVIVMAAVAVGASGSGAASTLKISDGKFKWKRLAYAAFDANGVLVPSPNIDIECKKAGTAIFSKATALATLQRGDQPTFELPDALDFAMNEEIIFVATGQSGSQVTALKLTLIGDETK